MAICEKAVHRYLRDVCGAQRATIEALNQETIMKNLSAGKSNFKTIQALLSEIDQDLHIEKMGFARAVIETVVEFAKERLKNAEVAGALRLFEGNMRVLFKTLRQKQRDAERELTADKVSARVNRAKASFLLDHPTSAKREHVLVLLEEIGEALDDSIEADEIRREMLSLQRDFRINEELTALVENYIQFQQRLDQLCYAGRNATQVSTLQELSVEDRETVQIALNADLSSDATNA